MTKREITDIDRKDAQDAMDAIYGGNQYTISDDDIEMMLEFLAIRKERANRARNLEMKEATTKRGVEW